MEAETGKGMWESHRITAFLDLGKEKALTVFPPTLVWFLSDQPDILPMDGFLQCRAASCALILLYQFAL
ncbi:MAG: hypothetical protein ACI4O4_11370 [Candidatus Ventricola sp.]